MKSLAICRKWLELLHHMTSGLWVLLNICAKMELKVLVWGRYCDATVYAATQATASRIRVPGPSPGCRTLPVQLSPSTGSQQASFKFLNPCHPCKRPRWSSWLLGLTWHTPKPYGHLGNELVDKQSLSLFLFLLVCVCVFVCSFLFAFQMHKQSFKRLWTMPYCFSGHI